MLLHNHKSACDAARHQQEEVLETTIQEAIRRVAAQTLATAQVPGLVIAVARGQQPAVEIALGSDAGGRPLTTASLFPVASITKLATALAVLRLVDAGAVALDDPLGRYLPDAAASQDDVTVRSLLCHTSGLPLDLADHAAPYAPGLDWPALARACLQTPLEAPPATRVQYSNVGYGLLAIVVERQTGQPFARALAALVLEPLGVEAYLGTEPARPPAMIADVRGPHTHSALEPYNSPFWRSLALPWAGMLTTAGGALRLLHAFLGMPAGFLRAEIRAEATRNQTGALGGGFRPPLMWSPCPWGLGPEIRGTKAPHWIPAQAGPDSFGHSGGSGCIAWAIPAADLGWAILGTRTADGGWLLRRGPAISAAILAGVGPG